MKPIITFDTITPSNLSEKDLGKIFELEQDMWARNEGLWEYVTCLHCDATMSKQDMYDKRNKAIYSMTVAEIEMNELWGSLSCPHCSWDVEHVFPREAYIEEMKIRYSQRAHMVIMKDSEEIVWFMDGHISDFDTIFERDFSYRYSKQNKIEISDAVTQIIWCIPELMFSCSSMWTKENYMFFHNVYRLLQSFFMSFPDSYEWNTWISELNVGGSLESIYKALWARSIDMTKISNIEKNDSYESWIFIQKQLGATYKQGFSKDLRTFLRERAI